MTAQDPHGQVTTKMVADVFYITIDRPAKLNALTPKILTELSQALIEAESHAVRAIILETSGDRAFCVGADIGIFSALPAEKMRTYWVPLGHHVFDQLANHRLPTLCKIQGLAFGGGLELAMACDFRIAADTAKFALPEGKIGTIPGWGGTARLVDFIGIARAKQMIMLGQVITAPIAEQWGLITTSVPADSLDQALEEALGQLRELSPVSVEITKQILAKHQIESALIPEAHGSEVSGHSAQFTEGMAAFTEKRPANFAL